MKKTLLVTLVACLASVVGVGPATAQSRSSVKLSLPFPVTFGAVTLPSGECTVTDLKNNGHQTFFLIRSDAGPSVEVLMEKTETPDGPEAAPTAVQLRHVGSIYEMQGIRIDGQGYRAN